MTEFISKLSSYNLFNYLFPWVVFISFLDFFTKYSMPSENIFILAFLSYFAWLVISRIWSVIVEPFLKWIGLLKFKEYRDFIKASEIDKKLEVLSEQNNVFRTIISMLFIIFFTKIYSMISEYLNFWNMDFYVLLIFLLIIFIIAYKKQTYYINLRIENNLKNIKKDN